MPITILRKKMESPLQISSPASNSAGVMAFKSYLCVK